MSYFITNSSSPLIQRIAELEKQLEKQHMIQRIAELEKQLEKQQDKEQNNNFVPVDISSLMSAITDRDSKIEALEALVSHYQDLAIDFEQKYLNAVEWSESYYTKLCSVEREKMILQNKLEDIKMILHRE